MQEKKMNAWINCCKITANMRLSLVITFVLGSILAASAERDKVFVLESPDAGGERKMVVTWSEEDADAGGQANGCEIFNDQSLIDEVVRASNSGVIRRPSSLEMSELLQECSTFSLRRRRRRRGPASNRSGDGKEVYVRIEAARSKATTTTPASKDTTTAGSSGWNVIFPGTKWCGAGDIAKNYDDLGIHQDTDRCCRAHDHCDDLMAAGETKNNLTNTSPFTALSCECDNTFYDCLERVNTVTSNTIGNTYFNVLGRPCYAKDYPKTKKCKKYKTFLKLTCAEYEKDLNAPKVYDWVKAKRYKKIPIPIIDVTLPF